MDREDSRGVHVLLVVSNSDVERRLREAFRQSQVSNRITNLESAEAALSYLRGRGEYAGRPRPDTVLVDLACSGVDGHELLSAIKEDRETRTIPVLVIAGTDDLEAVKRSYRLQANAVLERPVTTDEYEEFVHAFERFWLSRVQLPPIG